MTDVLIELHNVGFQVDDQHILKDISLEVKKGEVVVLTGPSGSGKSTLLKIIGSLLTPTAGEIKMNGKNIADYEPTEYRKEVSYFFQNAILFDETVRDNLSFPAQIRDEEFDEARAKSGLKTVQLPESYLDKKVQDLSGGEKQRVALIRNLMYEPEILLMDEVTSSLDKKNREIILSFIEKLNKEQDVTIIWITHNQEEIDVSNRVIQLVDGQLEGENYAR